MGRAWDNTDGIYMMELGQEKGRGSKKWAHKGIYVKAKKERKRDRKQKKARNKRRDDCRICYQERDEEE